MKRILITGATGYIGHRLTHVLAEKNHELIALVRSKERFFLPEHIRKKVKIIVADLACKKTVESIDEKFDAAYYLIHSMTFRGSHFERVEKKAANNFVDLVERSGCKQIIYMGGLISDINLSTHLKAKLSVEKILEKSKVPLTTLRAGIIIGAGSASFEIIRDLVEKLPFMIAPKWTKNRTTPISIHDVLFYLSHVLFEQKCLGKQFDIGGPETFTYCELLKGYAKFRKLKRCILTVPILTPRISSWWLFMITSTNFTLARNLVNSLKNSTYTNAPSICKVFAHRCLTYKESLQRAFQRIDQNHVISTWKDAWSTTKLHPDLQEYIQVPEHGCLYYEIKRPIKAALSVVKSRIMNIGGKQGWYSGNWMWKLRGWADRMLGGVGSSRGKSHKFACRPGDSLDFWRVLKADETHGELLLYAEMKLPGEGWLSIKILEETCILRATFRPHGLRGRIYWWIFYPFHLFLFPNMIRQIVKK